LNLEKKHKTRPPELAGFQLRGANILISWVKDYLVTTKNVQFVRFYVEYLV
jgi:hypothetical protein